MAKESELIKEKLDFVDFLRSYLTLLPAGRNFKALCPFHQEKTPSFIVSPDRKIWHCFGACGEGGDIIKFVMKYENLEFPEALRFLAEKAGIPMQALNPRAEREFGALYEIHEVAKDFFKKEFLKNASARDYLKKRKLEDETMEEFDIGFAPGGETLTLHLLKSGYDIQDIARAGLAHKNTRGLYRDRFESRLIFPLMSHLGKVVAFTGRLINSYDNDERPKYLNSPETPIFNKSKILYGLNKSKNHIAESRTVFLVEGQMDFLMSWQSGVKNAVAVSGTSLTSHHLERLRRLADSVVVSFDNDEAGVKALERSLDIFNNFDFHVKVMNLGKYKDPAEASEDDPLYLRRAVEWAKPAFEHLFDLYFTVKSKETRGIAAKKRLIRHFLSKIKNVKSAVEQDVWIKELARRSNVSETALFSELANLPAVSGAAFEEQVTGDGNSNRERIDLVAERLLSLAFAKREKFLPLLTEKREWLPLVYQSIINNPADDKIGILEMRSSFEFMNADEESLGNEFSVLLNHLEMEFLKKELGIFSQKIRLAEDNGDEKELDEIMAKFNQVAQRIDAIKSLI